jgi:hypothetical protein
MCEVSMCSNRIEVDELELELDPVKEGILCKNCMVLIDDLALGKQSVATLSPIDCKTQSKVVILIRKPPGHERLCNICAIDGNELCDGFISLSSQVSEELNKEWKRHNHKHLF